MPKITKNHSTEIASQNQDNYSLWYEHGATSRPFKMNCIESKNT